MAAPDRDTVYTTDGTRTTYTRESSATGWFVGIIVALALLAIGYLVFSANSTPSTNTEINNTPAITTPAPDTSTTPMTSAPAGGAATTPMTEAPAAPADVAPATPATPTPAAPADSNAAPAVETPAPATPATPAQ